MAEPTPQQVLALPLGENDADAATVRDYLVKLLRDLWRDEAGFDSKRPFGNSGWQYVYPALIRAGYVRGEILSTDGYVEDLDTDAADALMDRAILALGEVDRG